MFNIFPLRFLKQMISKDKRTQIKNKNKKWKKFLFLYKVLNYKFQKIVWRVARFQQNSYSNYNTSSKKVIYLFIFPMAHISDWHCISEIHGHYMLNLATLLSEHRLRSLPHDTKRGGTIRFSIKTHQCLLQ